MTAADREAAARRQRAQEIALWRWTLVEPAMDPALTARQRGAVVRDLASREHEGPGGKKTVGVSRRNLDRPRRHLPAGHRPHQAPAGHLHRTQYRTAEEDPRPGPGTHTFLTCANTTA